MSLSMVPFILQLAFATLMPVMASFLIVLLEHRTKLGKLSYWTQQIIYGLVFGAIAVGGTEFGIAARDATVNVRDAAPLVAGLFFGGPAGIIAGLVGGVERWFAALWGRGMFTRIACSAATCAAGFYAAALRKYVFDGRRPNWSLAFVTGAVVEVLHMLLVFMTHLGDAYEALHVVKVCSFPMIFCNALSVALASVLFARMSGWQWRHKQEAPEISQRVQLGMLAVVLTVFIATMGMVSVIQNNITEKEVYDKLSLSLSDLKQDIHTASDENLLSLARAVAREIPSVEGASQERVDELVETLELREIHIIDDRGIIVMSSDPAYVGFDMASGEQAAEFLCLLPEGGEHEFVQDYQSISMNGDLWRKFAGVAIDGGFVQVAYDDILFVGDLKEEVKKAVDNVHVGNGGMLVAYAEHGGLIGTRKDVELKGADVRKLDDASDHAEEWTIFTVDVLGQPYYGMYGNTEGLIYMSLMPVQEARQGRDLVILITTYMEVIAYAALFGAIYVLIKRIVVESIWQVNGTLSEITAGDLEAEVNVRDSMEFASLSDDINGTVSALRDAIAAEGARIEKDLLTAKAIQGSALPRTFPPFPDIDAFDLFASMNPAREVGGDFYDFYLIDNHTLAFLIADVSGKGIPAALFMMAAKSELANYMKSGMEVSEAVARANFNLCQSNEAGMFVTVWAALLDFESGDLTYVNAGHNPPLLRHEGVWEWMKLRGGPALGVFDTVKFRSNTITLEAGDEILLYTDGVNEAFSADNEEYGNDRLEAFLAGHANLRPRMLVDVLRNDVSRWAKGAEQSDDITMLCLEYGRAPELTHTFRVPATDAGLQEVIRRLTYEFAQHGCPQTVRKQLELTIEELFSNICKYSYVSDEGEVMLSYVYDTDPSSLTVSITDWGEPFDPVAYEGVEEDGITGMGILLAKWHVDDFAYLRDDDKNVVAFRRTW